MRLMARPWLSCVKPAGCIEGDRVLLTKGDTMAVVGQTNTMAVLTVPSGRPAADAGVGYPGEAGKVRSGAESDGQSVSHS